VLGLHDACASMIVVTRRTGRPVRENLARESSPAPRRDPTVTLLLADQEM
jgi:hypothetical protein